LFARQLHELVAGRRIPLFHFGHSAKFLFPGAKLINDLLRELLAGMGDRTIISEPLSGWAVCWYDVIDAAESSSIFFKICPLGVLSLAMIQDTIGRLAQAALKKISLKIL